MQRLKMRSSDLTQANIQEVIGTVPERHNRGQGRTGKSDPSG